MTRWSPWGDPPRAEIAQFVRRIEETPQYLDPRWMSAAYAELSLELCADPFDETVTGRIEQALRARRAYSVIRIGDGEANVLALDARAGTPALDRHLLTLSVMNQADRFRVTEAWAIALRDMMALAVRSADIIGVLGVWTPGGAVGEVGRFLAHFERDRRGIAGQWNGRDVLLGCARGGALRGTTIASAHLYAGVAQRIDRLLDAAPRVLCVTDRLTVVEAFRARRPSLPIDLIPVGGRRRVLSSLAAEPAFLARTRAAFPADLEGALCLVGAGPWAEFYCTWIKERGGVAVDLGSGFDLLAGDRTRPIHAALGWSDGT